MKLYKLEKVASGEYPIVRLTFKTWTGKFIVRDAFKNKNSSFWGYLDTGEISLLDQITGILNNFVNNNLDVFFVNGENKTLNT
jgi:hypothetical protein